MTHTITVQLIAFAVMCAMALIPMLARSWRMLLILAAIPGIFSGYFWMKNSTADWDKDRMAAGIIAIIATTGWIFGLMGATLRLIGQQRGWRAARFPITEGLVISVLFALFVLWLSGR